MSRRTTALWMGAIVAFTAITVGVIQSTEPEATREGAVKRTAMLVAVTTPEAGDFEPVLTTLGSVRAVQDVILRSQVSGRVERVAEAFVPGTVVDAGDALVWLDAADARNTVVQRRSALAQAEAAMRLERGRQAVARIEREQLAGEVSPEQEALILREPQLAAAEGTVKASEAALRQAELDLSRTRVVAPFQALVLDRTAHMGSLVSPGDALGRLVDVSQFWVEITLPVSQLKHLPLARGQATGSPVWVRDRSAWEDGVTRVARLQSVVQQLDERTRLARLLVAVDDPLGLEGDGPPLMVGSWVEAKVAAAPLHDVVRIDRALLRRGHTVWEMVEGKLAIRSVDVVLEDADYAYLSGGLAPDAKVVMTDLSTVSEGALLRTDGP